MGVDATHELYDRFAVKWARARDVIAGEDAIKAAGERYLPRMDSQSDGEFAQYLARASFFNGTGRTVDGFLGLIFRREPIVRLPNDEAKRIRDYSRLRIRDSGEEGQATDLEANDKFQSANDKGISKDKGPNGNGRAPGVGTGPTAINDSARLRIARDSRRNGQADVFQRLRNDADLMGTALNSYAAKVSSEVVSVGRAGTLVEWSDGEERPFLCLYQAEQIINWGTRRVNGRMELAFVALREVASDEFRVSSDSSAGGAIDFSAGAANPWEQEEVEQIRVLRLASGEFRVSSDERNGGGGNGGAPGGGTGEINDYARLKISDWPKGNGENLDSEPRHLVSYDSGKYQSGEYVVEIYRRGEANAQGERAWALVEQRVPLRRGKALPFIPFVFHGPENALPSPAMPPLEDIITVNLDHYRLDADFKHGLHFTALPTAWVAGFDKEAQLRIGSSAAWVTEQVGATAGFLEFKGEGLQTFERAMDRDERLMAVLGSRMLETQKRVAESAEALSIRQKGESSVVANIAASLSKSLTQALAWCRWWTGTEAKPEEIGPEEISIELNRDFETATMTSQELLAVVHAWQAGMLSHDSALNLMRQGELLPPNRSNEEERRLIEKDPPPAGLLRGERSVAPTGDGAGTGY